MAIKALLEGSNNALDYQSALASYGYKDAQFYISSSMVIVV
jgi:hypothetical protein